MSPNEIMMQRYAGRDDKSLMVENIPTWLSWAEHQDVAGAYIATWIAFNAIYVAEYTRPYAILAEGRKYPVKPNEYGLRLMNLEHFPSERDMVRYALEKMPKAFQRDLLVLPSPTDDGQSCIDFFAYRTPVWQGVSIERDECNQLVNGVVNVRRTLAPKTPHWSPINVADVEQYKSAVGRGETPEVPPRLIRQIGDILYTTRNNLFHGCKGSEDSNDHKVLKNAQELLSSIVTFYVDWVEQ